MFKITSEAEMIDILWDDPEKGKKSPDTRLSEVKDYKKGESPMTSISSEQKLYFKEEAPNRSSESESPSGPPLQLIIQGVNLPLDHIKLINREVTKQIPPAKIEALLDERNELVRKKITSGLSPKEDTRLTFIRWQLDRIEDAQHGEHLDYLEKLTENYEKFATDINVLFDQLKTVRSDKKTSKPRRAK